MTSKQMNAPSNAGRKCEVCGKVRRTIRIQIGGASRYVHVGPCATALKNRYTR